MDGHKNLPASWAPSRVWWLNWVQIPSDNCASLLFYGLLSKRWFKGSELGASFRRMLKMVAQHVNTFKCHDQTLSPPPDVLCCASMKFHLNSNLFTFAACSDMDKDGSRKLFNCKQKCFCKAFRLSSLKSSGNLVTMTNCWLLCLYNSAPQHQHHHKSLRKFSCSSARRQGVITKKAHALSINRKRQSRQRWRASP